MWRRWLMTCWVVGAAATVASAQSTTRRGDPPKLLGSPPASRAETPASDQGSRSDAPGRTGTLSPNSLPTVESTTSAAMRVTKGSGVLPNEHGQIWREYDISPYTAKVTSTEKPEQAIIDWILRETGTEVWFSEPLGVLSANKNAVRVYHTPEMQQRVAEVVDRFVSTQAESQVLGVRLATVGNPNWRVKAYPLMRQVDVQTPGVEAWLLSKENALYVISEMSKRTDYRHHNSPNLTIHNGQSQTISHLMPRTYVRSAPRGDAGGGVDTETAQIEEGYSLQISPLFLQDGKTVDAVIKCHIDQVERLVPISFDFASLTGGRQKAQIQVPQMVSWRLHERFRWPVDQVLLLSCGVVASPAPEARGAMAFVNALTTTPGRADALLFVECRGKANGLEAETPRSASAGQYRGRY